MSSDYILGDDQEELARLKSDVQDDDDQLADVQLPNGVDGPVSLLRGKR